MLAATLTPDAYRAILPIVWHLLTRPPVRLDSSDALYADEIGVAFLDHLLRQGSNNSIRSAGDEFLINVFLVHEQVSPLLPFYIVPESPFRPYLREWLASVPKTMWELGNKREEATEGFSQFLLEIGRRGLKSFDPAFSLIDAEALADIAGKLPAYFTVNHPTKGQLPGPWHRLSNPRLKRLILDMAQWWIPYDGSGQLEKATANAAKSL